MKLNGPGLIVMFRASNEHVALVSLTGRFHGELRLKLFGSTAFSKSCSLRTTKERIRTDKHIY